MSLRAVETAKEEVQIAKGQYIILRVNGPPGKPAADDIKNHLSWMHNEMRFRDASLSEIMSHLERWHNILFVTEKNIPLSKRLTVHIRGADIDEILQLLASLVEFKYRIQDKTVYLTR